MELAGKTFNTKKEQTNKDTTTKPKTKELIMHEITKDRLEYELNFHNKINNILKYDYALSHKQKYKIRKKKTKLFKSQDDLFDGFKKWIDNN